MQAYIKKAFSEAYNEDGLLVMGKGLGIPLLFSKFVQCYSAKTKSKSCDATEAIVTQEKLVLCLNVGEHEESIRNILTAEGVEGDDLPTTINNEVNAQERSDMYLFGGCYFITSRILIVDLLDNKLDANRIAGLLIFNAHRISETSIESFILRIFRERNRTGFIRAFCEDPESLTHGYMKVEQLLRSLFLQKLFLWPRFRLEIAQALQENVQPKVTELSLPLTKHMTAIQNAILVAMNTCLQELKKACPSFDNSQWTLENGLFHHFDYSIRSQLDPDWHRIPYRTKQIVSDLTVLRKLLDYLIRYDAFSFYYLLSRLLAASKEQMSPSLWLTSAAAEQIFKHAKARVYTLLPAQVKNKWQQYLGVQAVIKEVADTLHLSNVLEPVLECPPKWIALQEIVQEINEDFMTNKAKPADVSGTNNPIQSGRILLIVRDELALSQLKDLLLHGSKYVMDQRFRWFIGQQVKEISSRQSRAQKEKTAAAMRIHKASKAAQNDANKDPLSNNVGDMDWNDAVVQQILQESDDAVHAGSRISEKLSLKQDMDNGFLRLGLSEEQVRALSEEQQLILLHNRLMKLIDPESSQQSENPNEELDSRPQSNTSFVDNVHEKDNCNNKVKANLRKRRLAGRVENSIWTGYNNRKRPRTSLQCPHTIIFDSMRNPPSTAAYASSKNILLPKAREYFFEGPKENGSEESEEDDEGQQKAATNSSSNNFSFSLENDLHMVIITHAQVKENYLTCLQQISPRYIILYDADVYIVRAIEAYQSMLSFSMTVYFFAYDGSTEEHRYAGALAKEKKAFDSLIQSKEHMVISLPDHPHDVQKELKEDINMAADSRQRKALLSSMRNKIVVVDVREFRSTLPSLLYASQYYQQLLPRTLWIGDYILSPEICVERKGISDLFQSFASGRLYNQCEAMTKHYKYPCVLIEFQPDKPFSLVAASDITADIQVNSIISKIVLLVQSFPGLRLFWSRSPQSTVEIFRAVAANHELVDVEKAVSVGAGTEGGREEEKWLEQGQQTVESEDARQAAQEILLSLPGINVHNFREVMHRVENLAELSKMTESELSPIIGPANALKLVSFFRQQMV